MSTKSLQTIYGSRIAGANIRAENARERAKQAARELRSIALDWRYRNFPVFP